MRSQECGHMYVLYKQDLKKCIIYVKWQYNDNVIVNEKIILLTYDFHSGSEI